MSDVVIVAILSLAGTLAGSYFSQRKTTALVVYRLEELEKKVDKHNSVIERQYKTEEKMENVFKRIDLLERKVEK